MAVSQAEKYLWLGLSRSLQSVDEDDLPDDSIGIDSLTINLSSDPKLLPNSADVQMTNKLSQSVTETLVLTADGNRVASDTVTFTSGEQKTVTLNFLTIEIGNVDFTASIGQETATQTERIT